MSPTYDSKLTPTGPQNTGSLLKANRPVVLGNFQNTLDIYHNKNFMIIVNITAKTVVVTKIETSFTNRKLKLAKSQP